jgi:nitrate reductase (NAD(P)H)
MGIRFQHPAPVQPGALGNIGWREEENLARQGLEAAAAAPAADAVAPAKAAAAAGAVGMYTMEEVEQHATEESAWFVHEGKVGHANMYSIDLKAAVYLFSLRRVTHIGNWTLVGNHLDGFDDGRL